MSTVQGTLASEERLRWLTETLAAQGSVTIAKASEVLSVSEMTIRRDLLALEEQGIARRVRGGAKALGPQPFAARRQTAARAKSRIATKLVGLLPATGAVAFDASSTVMRLAGALKATRDLTVLTNGPDTFAALQRLPGVTALLTGGRLAPETGSLVGPLASRAAAQFTVSTFFASAAALDPRRGGMEMTVEEAEVKRSMAAGADRVVLAVDSSKLGARAIAAALEWGRIDVLVTELAPEDERLTPYRRVAEVL